MPLSSHGSVVVVVVVVHDVGADSAKKRKYFRTRIQSRFYIPFFGGIGVLNEQLVSLLYFLDSLDRARVPRPITDFIFFSFFSFFPFFLKGRHAFTVVTSCPRASIPCIVGGDESPVSQPLQSQSKMASCKSLSTPPGRLRISSFFVSTMSGLPTNPQSNSFRNAVAPGSSAI